MFKSTGDAELQYLFLPKAAVLTDAMRIHVQDFFSVYLGKDEKTTKRLLKSSTGA